MSGSKTDSTSPATPPETDERWQRLQAWLQQQLGMAPEPLHPVSGDASARRYFRIDHPEGTRVVMDAPPTALDSQPFVHVQQLMASAGLRVPYIYAVDLDQGFLLLEDLGHQTYLEALTGDNADELFGQALDSLILWQRASRSGELPDFNETALRRELQLFTDWYLGRHLSVAITREEREAFDALVNELVRRVSSQGRVWIHRDWMPRNLMPLPDGPGVLDFQDAATGPVTYDVASLFRDAFISWPDDRVEQWLHDYWRIAGMRSVPVAPRYDSFLVDVDWMGVQRHLKVLGIFARLRYRDGKRDYLKDAPRFLQYLYAAADRQPGLAPLRTLLDEWHGRASELVP
ncbi:hypothetical protein DFR31_1496 [Alkalispirillum mobile]|uniref:Aminoglycoside phosphotransferase domain-containing protein n=1 Tax=Alkalispirillum mobile TaxID=85925 RepID=A0A498C804_9GAMM|nr:phosphotransferase [Alkalispirillum mobile]RLK51553.1 hypothetical protein DFR31_1496 [Alkalispirillum mobile]